MSNRLPDMPLGQMIADLAEFDDREMAAVLDRLDAPERARALALLRRYADMGKIGEDAVPQDDVALSNWLRDRLRARGPMTRSAHEALVSASRGLSGATRESNASRSTSPSLLSRMGSTLSGRTRR